MHSTAVRPICGRCGTPLVQPVNDDDRRREVGRSHHALSLLLVLFIGAVCYGIAVTPAIMRESASQLSVEEYRRTEAVRTQLERDLAARRTALKKELAAIDANDLQRRASEKYGREFEGRLSYDKRFALSTREKAKLRMLEFSSNSAAPFPDVVRAVAREASPPGSEISVREFHGSIALHIDFDMSSMTSGEHGTRTKHFTKDSLRREVIILISRATNDIFEFCRDLDLSTIHVGCRHYVEIQHPDGTMREKNKMLYKIRLQKDRLRRVAGNPFLDVYSTAEYFEVEQDNFKDIEIIITRP